MAIRSRNFDCWWLPKGEWNRAHGDGKSTTNGEYFTETMGGSDGKYHVRVIYGGSTVLGPFEMPNANGAGEPTAEDVVSELRKRV